MIDITDHFGLSKGTAAIHRAFDPGLLLAASSHRALAPSAPILERVFKSVNHPQPKLSFSTVKLVLQKDECDGGHKGKEARELEAAVNRSRKERKLPEEVHSYIFCLNYEWCDRDLVEEPVLCGERICVSENEKWRRALRKKNKQKTKKKERYTGNELVVAGIIPEVELEKFMDEIRRIAHSEKRLSSEELMNDWNFYFWKNYYEDAPLCGLSSAEMESDWDFYHWKTHMEDLSLSNPSSAEMESDWDNYFWKNYTEDASLSDPSSAEMESDWDVYRFQTELENFLSDESSNSELKDGHEVSPANTEVEGDWPLYLKDEKILYTQLVVDNNSLDSSEEPPVSQTPRDFVDTIVNEDDGQFFYSELVARSDSLEEQPESESQQDDLKKEDEGFKAYLMAEDQVELPQATQELLNIACATPLPVEEDLFEIARTTPLPVETKQLDLTTPTANSKSLPFIDTAYEVVDEANPASILTPRTAEVSQSADVNYTAYPIPSPYHPTRYQKRRTLDYQDYHLVESPVEKRRRLQASSVDFGRPQTHHGHQVSAYTTKNAIIVSSSSSVTGWKRSCRVCGKPFSSFGRLIDHLRLLRHFSDSVDGLWEQGFHFPISEEFRQVHRKQSLPENILEEELYLRRHRSSSNISLRGSTRSNNTRRGETDKLDLTPPSHPPPPVPLKSLHKHSTSHWTLFRRHDEEASIRRPSTKWHADSGSSHRKLSKGRNSATQNQTETDSSKSPRRRISSGFEKAIGKVKRVEKKLIFGHGDERKI